MTSFSTRLHNLRIVQSPSNDNSELLPLNHFDPAKLALLNAQMEKAEGALIAAGCSFLAVVLIGLALLGRFS